MEGERYWSPDPSLRHTGLPLQKTPESRWGLAPNTSRPSFSLLEWPALRCCLQACAHLNITWADIQHSFSISIGEMFDTQHWAKSTSSQHSTHTQTHMQVPHTAHWKTLPLCLQQYLVPRAVYVCLFVCLCVHATHSSEINITQDGDQTLQSFINP